MASPTDTWAQAWRRIPDARQRRRAKAAQARQIDQRNLRSGEYDGFAGRRITDGAMELGVAESTFREYLRHPDRSPHAQTTTDATAYPARVRLPMTRKVLAVREQLQWFAATYGEVPNGTRFDRGKLQARQRPGWERDVARLDAGWITAAGDRQRFLRPDELPAGVWTQIAAEVRYEHVGPHAAGQLTLPVDARQTRRRRDGRTGRRRSRRRSRR